MDEVKYYTLKNKKVVPTDLMGWALAFESLNRHVAQTWIKDINVSTVFLGIDHNFLGSKLLLFETQVFGGEHDRLINRYSTWEEAEEGHAKICKRVEESLEKK
jgi:hypothetical protein